MTENNEQAGAFRSRVAEIISAGYEEMYVKLATHHDDDVIKALQEMGETEVLEGYAEWAEITLPGALDPEETTDGVVPDPHDAPSYDGINATRIMESFTAGQLLDLLKDFPRSYVEQTGGGTATLLISKTAGDVAIAAGPGSYDWTTPRESSFYSSEFYFGRWDYDEDGNEHEDEAPPSEVLDSQNPGTLERLAERIAATYAQHNTEGGK